MLGNSTPLGWGLKPFITCGWANAWDAHHTVIQGSLDGRE